MTGPISGFAVLQESLSGLRQAKYADKVNHFPGTFRTHKHRYGSAAPEMQHAIGKSDLFRRSAALNFIGHKLLKPPQIVVADAELLELGDGVKQIARARTDVATSAGEGTGNLR